MRCVILAAGPVKDYGAVRAQLVADDFVICADGGLRHLSPLGLTPRLVVGDFDSYDGPLPMGVEQLRFPHRKDDTDTMLAVRTALRRGFTRFLIVGGMGGRLDHTAANIAVLLYIARQGGEGVLFGEDNEVRVLLPGEMRLRRREGWYVSVFPLGESAGGVTERGMQYSLTDATLTADNPIGVSNEFRGDEAVIRVCSGALLIILSKS